MSEQNYLNERENLERYNKKVIGASPNKYFCVFRIGKKIKNMNRIRQFQYHMQRDITVLNADPDKKKFNRILIGNENIVKTVQEYIYGIKIRSNANIAIDLILTAHHKFFEELLPNEKEIWIEHNVKFIKDNFGGNCVYACAHFDETALHCHLLVIPRFWNEDKRRYELSSNKYFDGPEKLKNWQDKYAEHMGKKFSNLIRGIRGSPR